MPAKLPDDERRRQVTLKLPPALIARVDERRRALGMTKTEFHERALEAALGVSPGRGGVRAGERSSGAATRPVAAPAPAGGHSGVDRAEAFRRAQLRRG